MATLDDVRWFDDSKATTPHATVAAVSGFTSVVLIAGGRNKGLDLSIARHGTVPPVRAVVAMGEAADEVAAALGERCPVVTVTTGMADSRRPRRPPGSSGRQSCCSRRAAPRSTGSRSYAERGDAFAAAVEARHLTTTCAGATDGSGRRDQAPT